VLAQLGTPDMKVPIAYGLSFPERIASGAASLDFLALKALTFEEADRARFPGLYLAYDALAGPEGSSAVLNAANEEAVAAFLDGTIRFPQIHSVNARTVDAMAPRIGRIAALEDLMALEAQARAHARREIAACVR
jgi:1-deoxy-D-xylulose-5-phosphate reductoisomerase